MGDYREIIRLKSLEFGNLAIVNEYYVEEEPRLEIANLEIWKSEFRHSEIVFCA